MASVTTGANLLSRVEGTLQDTSNVRWTEAELLNYINDAQREIANVQPGATALHANVQLVTGTKQAIPSDGLKLINVIRNMSDASGGATGGRAIRLVSWDILDTQNPDWHDPTVTGDATHGTTPKHFLFDENDPLNYYIYPGISGNAYVEIVYSQRPTDLANTSATIAVPDNYSNAIIDYTLFRAFSKDAEFAGNAQRAATHYQLFSVSVQGKAQIDALIKPDIQIMSA
tara:strand:- start:1906 stop:2592 length:687 start_codon:yes stop_codon:yes gene_type:complete